MIGPSVLPGPQLVAWVTHVLVPLTAPLAPTTRLKVLSTTVVAAQRGGAWYVVWVTMCAFPVHTSAVGKSARQWFGFVVIEVAGGGDEGDDGWGVVGDGVGGGEGLGEPGLVAAVGWSLSVALSIDGNGERPRAISSIPDSGPSEGSVAVNVS